MTNNLFNVTLDVNPKIKKGDSVMVNFTLSNLTENDHHVLIWHTPLEGLISSECFEVSFNGQRIEYDGKMAMRIADPQPDSYVHLPANGKVSTQIDLTDAYSLKDSGKYTITTKSPISRLGAPDDEVAAQPASATFELTGTAPAKNTLGESARSNVNTQTSQGASVSVLAPTISGGTPTQQAILSQAWTNGYSAITRAVSVLSTTTQNNYDTVFANTFAVEANSANKSNALGYYSQIKGCLETSAFTLTINPTQDGGAIAYTYLNCRQIWFNPLFYTYCQPIYGTNSGEQDFCQPYLIVHELSHAVCSILDSVQNPPFESAYTMGYFAARIARPVITQLNLQRPTDPTLRTFTNGTLVVFNPSAVPYTGYLSGDFYISANNQQPPVQAMSIGDCPVGVTALQPFTSFTFFLLYPKKGINWLNNITRQWSSGLVPTGNYYAYSQIRCDSGLIGMGTYTSTSFPYQAS